MKRFTLLGVAAGCVLITASPAIGQQEAALSATVDAGRSNDFALSLYRQVSKGKKSANLFFSPMSIRMAMAMVYAGARGDTAQQMSQVLGLSTHDDEQHQLMEQQIAQMNQNSEESGFLLNVSNSIWAGVNTEFLKPFLAIGETYYGAKPRTLDFGQAEAARKTINDWVEEKTRDKIKDLIPPGAIDEATRMVLANAVYFKAKWTNPFKAKATKKDEFEVSAGKKVSAKMMQQEAKGFGYFEDGAVQVLKMPYMSGTEAASMMVVLPKNRKTGLASLEKTLTDKTLQKWKNGTEYKKVKVILPKFKTTLSLGLKETLVSMGVKNAFTSGGADFSAMNGKKDLYLSAVFHKAFVDVDENGTEAAAATAAMVGITGMPMEEEKKPPVFRADHPFLYMIQLESTGAILFMGRMNDPAAG